MNKEDILKDITFFTPQQLAIYVERGVLSENDILGHSDLTDSDKVQIMQFIDQRTTSSNPPEEPQDTCREEETEAVPDEDDNLYDITTLKRELREIAADKSVQDKVSTSFKKIEQYLLNNYCTTQDVLREIGRDHNWLGSDVIIQLKNKKYINDNDLLSVGIRKEFVQMLRESKNRVPLSSNVVPEPIVNESTEIYFWGMPSSGKTCALCAILGTVKNGGVVHHMSTNPQSSGFAYIKMATDMFKTSQAQYNSGSPEVTLLPLGTSELAFYELGLKIVDKNMLMHPITCIDMAGETIRSMYKANANLPLEQYQVEVLQSLNNILTKNHKPGNRMLHVFVVEYGAENRHYEGLDQITLLESTTEYLQNLQIRRKKGLWGTKQYGIFEEDADGIYVMVTKADKMNASGAELRDMTMEYLKRTYGNFYNNLKYICECYNINGGRVLTIPFSIGDTCFQDYCRFDPTTAKKFVERVMVERTYGRKENTINKLRH